MNPSFTTTEPSFLAMGDPFERIRSPFFNGSSEMQSRPIKGERTLVQINDSVSQTSFSIFDKDYLKDGAWHFDSGIYCSPHLHPAKINHGNQLDDWVLIKELQDPEEQEAALIPQMNKPSDPEEQETAIVPQINNKDISVKALKLNRVDEIVNHFGYSSKELTVLELDYEVFTRYECNKIKRFFPKLKHFTLKCNNFDNIFDDNVFSPLQGMALTILDLSDCKELKNSHLAAFQGMPLTSFSCSNCPFLTDDALIFLIGMPLESVNFSRCNNLKDGALVHLKRMTTLKRINFSKCTQLSDLAVFYLKDLLPEDLDFGGCYLITDRAFPYLKRMPLKFVNFRRCVELTNFALSHLEGKPIDKADFWGCPKITQSIKSR